MPHRVVKPFPYANDGVTLVDLNVGDERDFGELASGLISEGWVETVDGAIEPEPLPEPVPAPEPVPEPVPEPAPVPEPVAEPEKPAKKAGK